MNKTEIDTDAEKILVVHGGGVGGGDIGEGDEEAQNLNCNTN